MASGRKSRLTISWPLGSHLALHFRPKHISRRAGTEFPVESVVPGIVDRLERLADGVPGIDGVRVKLVASNEFCGRVAGSSERREGSFSALF
jgi:hypothetical protein